MVTDTTRPGRCPNCGGPLLNTQEWHIEPPDSDREVLTFGHSGLLVAYWSEDGWYEVWSGDSLDRDNVRPWCWRELPAVPIEGQPLLNTHTWIGRRFLPERHGQPCRLIASRRGKHLLEFGDGWRVATVRGTFRRI